ncbi:MAG: radical SAM protein [Candidatus Lokiarchaeota archaeon]
MPRPAWEIFSKLPYKLVNYWIKDKPVFTLNTSRGCPFNCTFCSVNKIWGRTYRVMSAKRIFEDVMYLIKQYGAKGIYFREDNFTLNKRRVIEFCNLLSENKVKISWICETRVDSLQDLEYVSLMAKSGCKAFYIGVESGSPRMLEVMNKQISIKQILQAFENAHKAKVKTYASLIYGVPYEKEEDLQLTNDLLKKIKPDFIGKNIFVGIPGSELYDYVKENKLYEFEDKNGLLYLKDHNKRVDIYYHGNPYAKIPGTVTPYEFIIFDLKRVLRQLLVKLWSRLNITKSSIIQNKIFKRLNKLIS